MKTINVTEKTGALVALVSVEEKDDLIITCESGITIRMKVADIRAAGRATQGVKLINIDEGDKIAAIARLKDQHEDAEEIIDETAENTEGEATDNTNTTEESTVTE